MIIPHHPVRKYRLPARAPRTHNRCDVEVQRTRRAAGRHYGARTTDEGARIRARLSGPASPRITAARPAAGNASRFVTEQH
ncbi:hypothetical protein, partial [Burkholderia anthinoferrum]|uniref:hypothetical protein n=1 Tax=Burkholderia anthinoferrum TaxID=3090833 RepID=UPI002B251588